MQNAAAAAAVSAPGQGRGGLARQLVWVVGDGRVMNFNVDER